MQKSITLKPLGQCSILVFQNEGAEALANFLQEHYFNAWATDEDNVISDIASGNLDIAILDYYKKYGKEKDLTLVHTVRKYMPNIPVILCVEDDDPVATVAAYNAGTYDVIHKPYNIEELACKMKVWMRYAPIKYIDAQEEYKIHDFILSAKEHTLFDGTNTIMLSDRELSILRYLFSCPNQLVLTPIILNAIWHQVDIFTKRSLDYYMTFLRKYLSVDRSVQIVTVFNKGYVLRVENKQ